MSLDARLRELVRKVQADPSDLASIHELGRVAVKAQDPAAIYQYALGAGVEAKLAAQNAYEAALQEHGVQTPETRVAEERLRSVELLMRDLANFYWHAAGAIDEPSPPHWKGNPDRLAALWYDVNTRFFAGALDLTVQWTAKPQRRRWAVFRPKKRLIEINRALDDPCSVPDVVVAFNLYHEALHAVVPSSHVHHTPEFRARERAFPGYEEAQLWMRENVLKVCDAGGGLAAGMDRYGKRYGFSAADIGRVVTLRGGRQATVLGWVASREAPAMLAYVDTGEKFRITAKGLGILLSQKNPDESSRAARRRALEGDQGDRLRAITDLLRRGLDPYYVWAAKHLGDKAADAIAKPVNYRVVGGNPFDWNLDDDHRAQREGWGFFESDNYGREIERDDETAEFPDHGEARPPRKRGWGLPGLGDELFDGDFTDWLIERAKTGDRFALKALVHNKQTNKHSYAFALVGDKLWPEEPKELVFARLRRGWWKLPVAVRRLLVAREREIVDAFLFGAR